VMNKLFAQLCRKSVHTRHSARRACIHAGWHMTAGRRLLVIA
jgi:hypothetical protein